MFVLVVILRLIAVLAIFAFLVRCAVQVARGYASRPGGRRSSSEICR